MRAQHLAPVALVAFISVVAGCSGGGSSGAPVAPVNGPVTAGNATFPLSITVPRGLATASTARKPQYVSPGTHAVAVYDGTTVIYVGNFNAGSDPQFTTVFAKTGTTSVTAGTCVAGAGSSTCTVTITTTIGAHTFDVITYPFAQGEPDSVARAPQDIGTVPSFDGVILSEGQLAVTLSPGTNPGQTITLLGVADAVAFTGPTLTELLNGTGPPVGIIGTSYTFQYAIEDSSGNQIIQPGVYDNGPVTIAETGAASHPIVTLSPAPQASPPASTGNQSFTVTCLNDGTATITATANNKPNTTYASGLTYNTSNYSSGTLGTTSIQCVPNSATIPITVDSVKRAR